MIKNYAELLNYYLDNYKDNSMFEYLDDNFQIRKVSYESFYKQVHTVIRFINEKDIKNQKIALCMINCYQWFVYYYAIVATGNVAVLVPVEADYETQKKMLLKTETDYLFTSNDYEYPVKDVFSVHENIEETSGLIESSSIDFESLAAIVFTSGTSGEQKAVCLSNKNCLFSVNTSMMEQSNGTKHERRLFTLPYAHIGGISLSTIWAMGNTLCVMGNAKYFLKCLKIYEPDSLSIVPTFYDVIIKKMAIGTKDTVLGKNLNSISCSSAVLPETYIQDTVSKGINLLDVYGMSETTGMGVYKCFVANTDIQVGGPFAGVVVEIIDGEVVIGGDCVMMGYYNDPIETEKILRNGKIYTGDIGHFEENGTLKIDGRKKNLIILSNGENISPESIEDIVSKSGLIDECLVYGKDDKIQIDLVVSSGHTQDELKDFIDQYNKETPFSKRIQKVHFVEALERNATGKIKRNK